MTVLVVRGGAAIAGALAVPGDKSISHRALMLAALADGRTTLRSLGPGRDVASTASCLRALGAEITERGDEIVVTGRGLGSLRAPETALDCGNSGTTMRLLAGLAAHDPGQTELDGDASLRSRPMQRLVEPLGALGARVETSDGRPPLRVSGGSLRGTEVRTPVASAQVKSAVLLAALAADGATTVIEPRPSRDHTERMLAALGAAITTSEQRIELKPFAPPPFELDVPGDASSAAFLVAAGVLAGEVVVEGVGLNPRRTAFLDTLTAMGASIEVRPSGEAMGEPVGTIHATRCELEAVEVDGGDPAIQDELPLLAVLAACATGTTVVTGAEELRVKESDRIASTTSALRAMGANIRERPDGFAVTGPTRLRGARVDAAGDHRIAMALAVAGLVGEAETVIDGYEAAAVSWPGFEHVLRTLGAHAELR